MYEDIINDNLGIITKVAKKYSNDADEYEDYFQEACYQTLYLYKKYFNKSKGVKFSTYLYKSLPYMMLRIKKTRKMSLMPIPEYKTQEINYDNNKYAVNLTDNYEFIDTMNNYKETPEAYAIKNEDAMKDDTFKCIGKFEKEILRMHYGVGLDRCYTHTEIGDIYNKSRSTIARKIEHAITKIQNHARSLNEKEKNTIRRNY